MKLKELLPIIFGLFFALESWNREVSNYGQVDNQEQTVSEMISDIGLTQIKKLWLINFVLSAPVSDR